MSRTVSLTARDRDLLLALVVIVRLLSQRQIATGFFHDQVANTRRRLRQLAVAGWISRIEIQARTLPNLPQPIVVWRPGQESPDYEAVSWQLQSRWQSLPVRPCCAYIATEKARQQFGGRGNGELKHPLQATHDLGVAQVWLQLRDTAPQWAEAWRGEDVMAHTRAGEKCPDAFIVNERDEIVCVIEFGGAYQAERIRDFHEDCATRSLPYQIW